jgi:hypothetical protein
MFGIDFGQKVGDHWWANSITQHEEGVAVLPRQCVASREAHGHLGLGNPNIRMRWPSITAHRSRVLMVPIGR